MLGILVVWFVILAPEGTGLPFDTKSKTYELRNYRIIYYENAIINKRVVILENGKRVTEEKRVREIVSEIAEELALTEVCKDLKTIKMMHDYSYSAEKALTGLREGKLKMNKATSELTKRVGFETMDTAARWFAKMMPKTTAFLIIIQRQLVDNPKAVDYIYTFRFIRVNAEDIIRACHRPTDVRRDIAMLAGSIEEYKENSNEIDKMLRELYNKMNGARYEIRNKCSAAGLITGIICKYTVDYLFSKVGLEDLKNAQNLIKNKDIIHEEAKRLRELAEITDEQNLYTLWNAEKTAKQRLATVLITPIALMILVIILLRRS